MSILNAGDEQRRDRQGAKDGSANGEAPHVPDVHKVSSRRRWRSRTPEQARKVGCVTLPLTRTELRVVQGVVGGYSNRAIATQIGTTEQVVKNHLTVCYNKSGMSDRLELAIWYLAHREDPKVTGEGK